jgi:tricorn protease
MRAFAGSLLAASLLPLVGAFAQTPAALPSFADPAPSPDGSEIAFVSGGDVWTVPAAGGEARLLVSHSATESRPLYSPDGRRLAFVSTRTGGGDVYVLTLATGELRRLTFDDAPETLDAWSRDGGWLYFSSSARDIAGMMDVHRVRATGGTPMVVAGDRYASEYWAAPSAEAGTMAITARGLTSGQWWRRGHSHIDESEIWLVRTGGDLDRAPRYEPVTSGGAKSAWPVWAGGALYFMSDKSGAENLWMRPAAGGEARQVTRFTDGRLLWPAASHDGRVITFERDFGVWRLDVASGAAARVPITLRGAPSGASVEHLALTSNVADLALSPDGKKMVLLVRGELFAAAATSVPSGVQAGGDAQRVTFTPAAEVHPVWAPDSRRIAYASNRGGAFRLYLYDFGTRRETALTEGSGEASDLAPRWSPDGRSIAYVHDGRELRVLDVATRRSRTLATGIFGQMPFVSPEAAAWSPDGRWLAYASGAGSRGFTNAFLVPAAGGASRQVSWVPHAFGGGIRWGADGSYLLMSTAQRTESGQIARVDLVPRTPRFREDQFRGLFEQETQRPTSPATTPAPARRDSQPSRGSVQATDSVLAGARPTRPRVEPVFEDIRTRLSMLPVGVDVGSMAVSPDGRQLLLVASAAGQTNLYVYPLDELATESVARQVTSTPGNKSDAHWSPDGRELFYLEGGRVAAVNVETRAVRPIAVTAEMDVDFSAEKMAVFAQAWSYLHDNFFDDRFNGVNWADARARYAPRVAGARTSDEMRRVLSLMIGELNASHTGISGPGAGAPSTGRLGVRFDRAAHERDGTLRVSEVLPLGPAALAGVREGDAIVAIDGAPIVAATNLDSLLAYRINRRTSVTLAGAGGARREVALRPVSLGTEKGLAYRAWVEGRRAYVAKASNGRLGYVHIPDMSAGSLTQLYADLDAENQSKEGVVVDVRNNNGGFVNAYALDVFSRRPYLTMQTRGEPAVPARAQLGQRSLELPTVLVTNQHSLSDAAYYTAG